eukprot:scaffold3_cov389-Prasinococcus_capsulatus_cf.AAC.20
MSAEAEPCRDNWADQQGHSQRNRTQAPASGHYLPRLVTHVQVMASRIRSCNMECLSLHSDDGSACRVSPVLALVILDIHERLSHPLRVF